MGSFFTKNKTPRSRVTEQDKAVLLKHQRDLLKRYQKRIQLSLENDRQLAKKCLASGRKERAKLLLRKKKFQETLLMNTDKQLENLEKLATDIEYAQVEANVVDALKQGNEALKKMHAMVDINEIERIMDETREGVEKQREIDSLLSEALSEQDENDVLIELDALVAEEEAEKFKLPEVPQDELSLPSADETPKESKAAIIEKPKKILIEA
ncbi:charged multivesicular body protein 6-A isoform X2 [Glossina fuscipes]|uniref:Charged multivesicular body protein 6-A isoform X2 n=1 Tax=Glossina fuscipes TaxID=7396 RepID=A0A9C6DJA8_9MUSC|nr:charged multivesicular body protein 6-A isoform X2 [Glossina fuscipes]